METAQMLDCLSQMGLHAQPKLDMYIQLGLFYNYKYNNINLEFFF